MTKMNVVTISRELGSEGDRIANMLAEELGYGRVDKKVLNHIAKEAGIDIKAVLEKEKTFTRKPRLISGQMTSLYQRAPTAFEDQAALDDKTYARIVHQTMARFAEEGNVIIVGRGGQMILRDRATVLHIHLYAPPEVRAQRLMKRASISELEARRHIERSDEHKRQYIRYMHKNANWKDPKYYHLMINTGVIPLPVAAQIIVQAVHG
jgi:cytidylate kinase